MTFVLFFRDNKVGHFINPLHADDLYKMLSLISLKKSVRISFAIILMGGSMVATQIKAKCNLK